eukprot:354317-Chlamydomonas_euryale.AAC.4
MLAHAIMLPFVHGNCLIFICGFRRLRIPAALCLTFWLCCCCTRHVAPSVPHPPCHTAGQSPTLPGASQSAARGPDRATRSNSRRRHRLNCYNAKIRSEEAFTVGFGSGERANPSPVL